MVIVTNSCNSNDNNYYLTSSTFVRGEKERVVKKNKDVKIKQNNEQSTYKN